jgi:sigma-E factor negative regulatory protein RseC
MIEEQAKVIEVDGDFAVVETERKSACGHCSAASACGTSLLEKLFAGRTTRLRVLRAGHELSAGEQVIVGLQESAMLQVSFIVYGLPLLCMILFSLAGLAIQQLLGVSEWPVVVMAIAGLATGFGLVRFYSLTRARDARQQAVVIGKPVVSTINVVAQPSIDDL